MFLGVLVGTPIGYAIATEATLKEKKCGGGLGSPPSHDTCIATGAVIGFFGGALVGALIGAGIREDRWNEVSLSRLRVSLRPQRDGTFGLGASVRF